jgi:hypothetical protein
MLGFQEILSSSIFSEFLLARNWFKPLLVI